MSEQEQRELLGNMSRRRFLGMGGLAAGAVVLGACGEDEPAATTAGGSTDTTAGSTATTAGGATTTTGATATTGGASAGIPTTSMSGFTVGYNNPNRLLRAPLFVGQSEELGFFEEVGITDFEINDADDPVPPMLAGEYLIAGFDSDVLFDANDKDVLDAKLLNSNLGIQSLILIANEGIESAEDLVGKRVGTGRAGAVNEAFAKYMIEDLGLTLDDIIPTEMTGGSNDWVQAMLTGQIDATIAFARHIPLAEEAGGGALYNDFLPFPQYGFAMRTEDLEEHADFAAAWSYAYIKAQRWVKDKENNFDALVRILSEEFGIDLPDAFFDDAVFEVDQNHLTKDLGFDPNEMDNLMNFVAPFGNVAPDINERWRGYVDVSGLHVAQEAHGLELNPSADLTEGEQKVGEL